LLKFAEKGKVGSGGKKNGKGKGKGDEWGMGREKGKSEKVGLPHFWSKVTPMMCCRRPRLIASLNSVSSMKQ